MKESCIYCGSNNTVLLEKIVSPFNGKTYRLNRCFNCLIEFVMPNVFEEIYTDGVMNDSMNDYFEQLHQGRDALEPPTREVVKQLKKRGIDLKDKKILDIGAGDGINFLALQKHFQIQADDYYAVECDAKSIEICRRRGIKNISSFFFNAENSSKFSGNFDIVIFTEVFEHQTDPQGFMRGVMSVTKPGGLIIFTVPNRKMLKISRKAFLADYPPHHFLRADKDFFLKNFPEYGEVKAKVYPNPFVILNKRRACRKISKALFRTESLWQLIYPLFGVLYLIWQLLLYVRGNGIVVVLRKAYQV